MRIHSRFLLESEDRKSLPTYLRGFYGVGCNTALDTASVVYGVGDLRKLLINGAKVSIIESTYNTQTIRDTLGNHEGLFHEEIPTLMLSFKSEGFYLYTRETIALTCLSTLATGLMPDGGRMENL
jgi:hypothetical protein